MCHEFFKNIYTLLFFSFYLCPVNILDPAPVRPRRVVGPKRGKIASDDESEFEDEDEVGIDLKNNVFK